MEGYGILMRSERPVGAVRVSVVEQSPVNGAPLVIGTVRGIEDLKLIAIMEMRAYCRLGRENFDQECLRSRNRGGFVAHGRRLSEVVADDGRCGPPTDAFWRR